MFIPRVVLLAAAPCLILLAACNRDPRIVSRKYVDSGNKYFNRGKFKEASIMYRRALAKDMRCADAWYHLGLTNLNLHIPGEARRDFMRAMEIDPGNTDAIRLDERRGYQPTWLYLSRLQGSNTAANPSRPPSATMGS